MTPAERMLFELRNRIPLHFCSPLAYAPSEQWNKLRSATITLLSLNGRQLGLTNDHVLEGIERMVDAEGQVECRLGWAKVDPLDLVLDRCSDLDIAVLDLGGVDAKSIRGGSYIIPTHYFPARDWPPRPVERDELLMIGGFPGALRRRDSDHEFTFRTLSGSAVRVENVYEDRIGCRLEPEGAILESDVPGEELPDLAGMSGGCAILNRTGPNGEEMFALAGIIQEYRGDFDMCYLTPAGVLASNGTIIKQPGAMLRANLKAQNHRGG